MRTGHLVVGLVTLVLTCAARAQDGAVSVVVWGSWTTDGQIFPDPDATGPLSRSQSYPVSDVPGLGAEIRYRFPASSIMVGLGAGVVESVENRSQPLSSGRVLPIEDGLRAVPVELSGYFILPFSGQDVRVYMGGGAGAYFGRRISRFAGVDAPVVDSHPGFGIHVAAGIGWRFVDRFVLLGEMKFRDLQFSSTNAFQTDRTQYLGTLVNLGTRPFSSTVHVDGIVFQLGLSAEF